MKVEPKRVKKVDSPLLIVGLGGTGTDALLTIVDKFHERFILEVSPFGQQLDAPERTAYLAFDTDIVELKSKRIGHSSFRAGDIFQLQIPSRLASGTIPSYISEWFDTKLTDYQITNGAGGIRQAGRYVLFHNVNAIVAKLVIVIKNLIALPSNATMGTLEIVLTTGISGGTGSGTFMDMAYLIRYVLSHHFPQVKTNFTAYILTPPVNVDRIGNVIQEGKRQMLESTGFAALKELDFWMNYNEHQYPFKQQYSADITVPWDQPPFDNVVLMGNAKKDGTVIQNAYANCLDVLGESVLNFYADEENDGTGQISLRSHLSNVAGQYQFLTKRFPANYTYMSVGAAASDSQKKTLVTYEAQLTFNRLMALATTDKVRVPDSLHAAPLLGAPDGSQFLENCYPPETDYFADFANEWMDPGFFSDPSFTPRVIHDSEPIHDAQYKDWVYECEQQARDFAVREVSALYGRFREEVGKHAANLTYGPFETSAFLQDANSGFVGFMARLVNQWKGFEDSCQTERNSAYADASGMLYAKMADMKSIAMTAGLWGPVIRYKDGCEHLFHAARDYALAREMVAELEAMQKNVLAYCNTILPAFCAMLRQISGSLDQDMRDIQATSATNQIIPVAALQQYVDHAFDAAEQDRVAIQILEKLVTNSQSVKLDNMGELENLAEVRAAFEQAADHYVASAAEALNGDSMDVMLKVLMPGATAQQQVDYLSQKLLPSLKRSAQTMLPLSVGSDESNEYISYAYTSVPKDSPILKQGVTDYQQSEMITPKQSVITDRVYWLNTLNCIPMYMYVDLDRLERVYEHALVNLNARGLHLVYATHSGKYELYNNWSMLPSPVVHELQQVPMPKTVAERRQAISALMQEGLENGSIALNSVAGKEQLIVTIRRNNGMLENMEQFEAKLRQITGDSTLSPEDKLDALRKLGAQGEKVTIEYANYTQIFADAHHFDLTAPHGTQDELTRAERNTQAARILAAEYILYAWRPQLAEQLIAQRAMHKALRDAVAQVEAELSDMAAQKDFAGTFMALYLSKAFNFGRQTISFQNVRGENTMLLNKSDLTETELTVYTEYCAPLVLMQILANPQDGRVDPNDRRYLVDKGTAIRQSIERMSDEEYDVFSARARDFIKQFAETGNLIKYDRGDMPLPLRDKNINLLAGMLHAARSYS